MPLPSSALLDASKCDAQSLAQGDVQQLAAGDCVRATPALRSSMRPLAAAPAGFTVDMLMEWAQATYPDYFAATDEITQFASPYAYRYYAATDTYLGVAGEDIYVKGPLSGGVIARVGSLADFSCVAARIGCMVPGAPTLILVKPLDGAARVTFTAPASAGTSPILSFTATCAHGISSIVSASGTASPIVVPNMVNGLAYSCIVTATNSQGISAPSAVIGVTPMVPLSAQQTKVSVGTYIGDKPSKTYEYTKANAQFSGYEIGGALYVFVVGDTRWQGVFGRPEGTARWVGGTTYTVPPGYTWGSSTGGFDWSGSEFLGCSSTNNTLTVNSATYNEQGVLDSISLSFVCDSGAASLRGQVTWGADDPTPVPGPGAPPPSNLWKPAARNVPASGNFVYLESETGDYVGAGDSYSYTSVNASSNNNLVTVEVNPDTDRVWKGVFASMESVAPLQAGYYGDVHRWPFNNPVTGGFEWSGMGRGCNVLSGWFMIDDIVYDGTTLKSVSLRFEQHCENAVASLRGQVRWSQ